MKIVVIGDGFAGYSALLTLQKSSLINKLEISIIGKGYFEYKPLLPQIISGKIDSGLVRFNYEKKIKRDNIQIIRQKVEQIDLAEKKIRLDNTKDLSFDY
ncbi:MAG: FAD-dependent oxidoreductase, partial [Spirochaetes bacterium]|nr:FAD-dependent oxidoreductase [Spirochaetota bacterium]